MKPVIVVPYWEERWLAPYAQGVIQAGATARPLALPGLPVGAAAAANALAGAHGLLLIGGGDVEAARFGADDPQRLSRHVTPARDAAELALLEEALRRDLPVLAICRGHQVLGVARGGALHVDLPTERGLAPTAHQRGKEDLDAHPVTLAPGSLLESIMGSRQVLVNSRHHQAIRADRVGAGLRVTALSDDGVVEGVESAEHAFVVGVQWHPEDFVGRDDRFAPLFHRFVARAAAWGRASPGAAAATASATRGAHHTPT